MRTSSILPIDRDPRDSIAWPLEASPVRDFCRFPCFGTAGGERRQAAHGLAASSTLRSQPAQISCMPLQWESRKRAV